MTKMTMKERVARAIHEGLGESWAYCNYSGNEWVQCRDMLDSAADFAIAVMSPGVAAEAGWQPESTAPAGKMLITYRLGEEDVTRAGLRIWPDGDREWIAPDGRTTVTHHSYAPPTHWLCEAPPTPTTKEEKA